MDGFLQKLKKVVRIVLNGPAISQSDFKKSDPYQLPSNNNSKTAIFLALESFPKFAVLKSGKLKSLTLYNNL